MQSPSKGMFAVEKLMFITSAKPHISRYVHVTLLAQTVCVHPTQEPARQYITVMQPSEGSFAVAIAVDCTGGGPFTPPPH